MSITMRRRLETAVPILGVLLAFLLLLLNSGAAQESARRGLELCARVIVPSLLPFFVLSNLLSELGLPRYLGRYTAPAMSRLFNVGGEGAASFVLGLSGGYPLGAVTVTQLYERGGCKKEEAERLLAFCNNSGPAFIVGAAGLGAFGSPALGLWLYLVHVLAAALVGVILSASVENGAGSGREASAHFEAVSFAGGFSSSVKAAISSVLSICGFVIFFGVVTGVLENVGVFTALSEGIAALTGMETAWARALLTGALELGSGIGAMIGFTATPANLALCAFVLGWGGVSVHCQVVAAVSGTDLSVRKHTYGRFLHGIISAILILGLDLLGLVR